jgi:hypothetical protein
MKSDHIVERYEIRSEVNELLRDLINRQNQFGFMKFYIAIRDEYFSFAEQLHIISVIHCREYDIRLTSISPVGELRDNATYIDKIYIVMDSWEEAWIVAIHNGIPYRGYNQCLNSIAALCQ